MLKKILYFESVPMAPVGYSIERYYMFNSRAIDYIIMEKI